jgi:hypothetical protein
MKCKKSARIGIISCAALLCLSSASTLNAQTATNLPVATATNAATATPANFFATVESYFTAFDTNNQTFGTNTHYEMWTGTAYQSGINLGAQFGLEARPFTKLPSLTIGAISTLANSVGTLAEQEIDLGWSIRHYDVELTLGGGGMDAFHGGSEATGLKGTIFAEVKKALSANTFSGIRLEGVFGSGQKANQPIVGPFAGFTF